MTMVVVTDVTTIPPTLACTNPEVLRNIAVGKAASQSSTNKKQGGVAELAVDGNKNTDLRAGKSCTWTNKEFQPWWKLDLGSSKDVYQVVITNRQDCCSFRLKNAEVRVGDDPKHENNPVCGMMVMGKRSRQETVTMNCGCGESMQGRYVSIQLKDKTQQMHLCEVEVMTL
ncbi:fucolectin-1-like [Saccoglossus kowalevskii]